MVTLRLSRLVLLCLVAAALGAGILFAIDRAALDSRDRRIAELTADMEALRAGLSSLEGTNAALRSGIGEVLRGTAEVAQSNRTSAEKLRQVLGRLEALQSPTASSQAAASKP